MKKLLQFSILFITILFMGSCGSDSSGPNPEITSVQPESGPPGTSVTIAGKGFRAKGDMSVTFDSTTATLISATEDQIQTEVPEGLSEGSAAVEVSVEGVTASGPSFMVEAKAPGISSVEPDSGTVGTEVTIKGMNFSATASENSISFNGTDAPVNSAAKDELVTEVPQGATDGPLEITVKQKSTTGPDFDVITEGTIQVTTQTSGSDQDEDGYSVTVDGASGEPIGVNDDLYFTNVLKGSHDVSLSGIAGNCSPKGNNPKSLTVNPGDTTKTTFEVNCNAVLKNKIVFDSDRDGDREIFVMDSDGSNQAKITDNTIVDVNPVVSNDGQKISFLSVENGKGGIYIMNVDGSNRRRVTTGNPFYTSWSPDDSQIVFEDDRDGNDELYVINVDGTGEKKLTDNSISDGNPSWSPDGDKIIFHSKRDGDFEIYSMNPDGSGVKKITDDSYGNTRPRWSPDGNKITFLSDRDGDFEIFTMNSDGSGIKNITNNSTTDNFPAWSADGSEIIYVGADSNSNADIFKKNADGTGTATNLTANPNKDYYPFWSPVK